MGETCHLFSMLIQGFVVLNIVLTVVSLCVCVCACVCAHVHVFVTYEDTNVYNDMGMT